MLLISARCVFCFLCCASCCCLAMPDRTVCFFFMISSYWFCSEYGDSGLVLFFFAMLIIPARTLF